MVCSPVPTIFTHAYNNTDELLVVGTQLHIRCPVLDDWHHLTTCNRVIRSLQRWDSTKNSDLTAEVCFSTLRFVTIGQCLVGFSPPPISRTERRRIRDSKVPAFLFLFVSATMYKVYQHPASSYPFPASSNPYPASS